MSKTVINLDKIITLVLLSVVQIGLFIFLHDGLLEYFSKTNVHDLNWGISLKYFLYTLSIGVVIHNTVFLFFINQRYTIYIFAILCLIALLSLIQISIYPLRSIYLIICALFSLILPFEIYYIFKRNLVRKKT
jgi:hypothetical protein